MPGRTIMKFGKSLNSIHGSAACVSLVVTTPLPDITERKTKFAKHAVCINDPNVA
jgi:hypothetical protein